MKFDVIVVGFGTAGSMAAIAAARLGAKVLILEKTSYPGGLQTGGFITSYYKQKAMGLAAEMEESSRLMKTSTDAYTTGIEPKKLVLERAVTGAGAEIHYEVSITGVLVEDKRVCGVRWFEGDREMLARAKTVIDSTAEAEIASLAGCEFVSGRVLDGRYQHAVDLYQCVWLNDPRGRYGYCGSSIRMNQEFIKEFSTEMLKGSAALAEKNNVLFRLAAPSDAAGIREGRHIVTENVVTMKHCLLAHSEPIEPIAYAYSEFDTNISDIALESESFQDWMFVSAMWGKCLWFSVPKDVLFPRSVEGLLVAGRHLGVDHDVGHALRMNSLMSSLGEAAGIIAAYSVKMDLEMKDVPYSLIASQMRRPPSPLAENNRVWGLSDEDIKSVLGSDRPGKGIWSAYRSERMKLLEDILKDAPQESTTQRHAVFALALLKAKQVVPLLRSMVARRDRGETIALARDKHIAFRAGYIAVYLLGRFRDPDSVDLLINVLTDTEINDKYEYHSFSVIALLKIGEAYPSLREKIAAALRAAAENPNWVLEARFLIWDKPMVRMDIALRIMIARELSNWNSKLVSMATVSTIDMSGWERALAGTSDRSAEVKT